MEITWYVSDSYINNGPHRMDVPDEEIADCESVEEAKNLIEDYAYEEFSQSVTYEIRDYNEDEIQHLLDGKERPE
jgi:hypothetical protein